MTKCSLFGHKYTKAKPLPFTHKLTAGEMTLWDESGTASVRVCIRCNSFNLQIERAAGPEQEAP